MDMKAFYSEIDRYAAAHPSQQTAIEAEIWDRYGVNRAVLALDMSEFSLSVRRDGVLSYLCRIRRMHAITEPLVIAHGGQVVKYQADNMLAVFETPALALKAALAMRKALIEDIRAQPVSIGLCYGRVLLIPGIDSHGDATNVAFKLGEDVALAGEILASANFVRALEGNQFARLEAQTIHIAGLTLEAYRVVESA
jgi:class 3 adenylate cyclase